MKSIALVCGLLASMALQAMQPDLAREQRMAEQISDAIFDGEPIWLKSGNSPFLGIFTEADGARGTVIILHGRGFHPDWTTVVQPLRVGLVEHGWNTLSIQMPVLAKQAKYYDYVEIFPHAIPRIEAAIAHAKERAPQGSVVLLAHSCGSHMAHHWMHQRGEQALQLFDAYIGIGMGAVDYGQKMLEHPPLERIGAPVLDVFGEADYPAVLRMADTRLQLMLSAGNPKSAQRKVPGAGHYFEGQGQAQALTDLIASWLETL